MRNFLTLLMLILSCASFSIAQTKTDWDRAGLIGSVKTIRLETSVVSNVAGQSVEGARVLLQVSSFDERGGATGQSVFNPDGSLKRKLGWASSYDAKGRETERLFLNADGARTSKAVSTYDEKDHKTETTFYNPNGSINHVEAFAYDNDGRLVRETHRNPDGTIRNTSAYTYDSKGRLTEWNLYKPDGTLSQRNVSTYDAKGREIGSDIYRGDGTPAIGQTRSYDDRGNVTELLRYANGAPVSRETFTYEFDARGNWVKRRAVKQTTQGGVSREEVEVYYRTITYY